MLYAGLMLNAAVLESVGFSYALIGNLTRLCIVLLAYGAFLGFAIFYLPARLGADDGPRIEDLLRSCIGSWGAWLFAKILFPIWIFAWFCYNTAYATRCLDVAIFHAGWSEPGIARRAFIGLIWLILIAPAAMQPFPKLAKFSVFTTKVSVALIFGLALSGRAFFQTIASYPDTPWKSALPLEANVLLWMAPPLFFAGRITRDLKVSHRTLLSIIAFGITLPVLFTVLSGMLTLTGAEGIGQMHPMKFPSYLRYADFRQNQLGWVKILLLTFTFLAATRFAASLGVSILPRRSKAWILATIALAIFIVMEGQGNWMIPGVWEYAAVPFIPLAGVLCAAYLRTRGRPFAFSLAHRCAALLACVAGCVVAFVPAWSEPYGDPVGIKPAWVSLSWLVAFTFAWLSYGVHSLPFAADSDFTVPQSKPVSKVYN